MKHTLKVSWRVAQLNKQGAVTVFLTLMILTGGEVPTQHKHNKSQSRRTFLRSIVLSPDSLFGPIQSEVVSSLWSMIYTWTTPRFCLPTWDSEWCQRDFLHLGKVCRIFPCPIRQTSRCFKICVTHIRSITAQGRGMWTTVLRYHHNASFSLIKSDATGNCAPPSPKPKSFHLTYSI